MRKTVLSSALNRFFTTRWQKRYELLALCFCAAFICYIDRVNISVAAIAMQETLGWSETTKGYVLSSFFIGYMLLQAPAGYLASRYGGKIVLGVAVAWWSVFTILTPLAATISLPLLIAVRIGMGLGEAAMFPGAYALFGRWIPATERSRAISILASGVPLGTVFALVMTGWMIARFGWPAVFYIFGAIGFVWVLVWFPRAYDSPEKHPNLSPDERALLVRGETEQANTKTTIPWGKLLRAPAVWALIINHFCSNWGLYMLLAWLPSYFRQVQGFSIEYAGLFSAAPWLSNFFLVNVASWTADGMIKRGVSLTRVRKIMQTIGLGVPAICLLLVSSVNSPIASVLLMCGAVGAIGFAWSGFATNHLDLAPRYAGVLMGITNTIGTLPGVIGVVVTGWLIDVTGAYSSPFILAALINLFGMVVWWLWGTGRQIVD